MSFVDVQFNLQGDRIPADHGYLAYSAVSKFVKEIHEGEEFGIHAISGRLLGDRMLEIVPHSRLTFRLPVERVKDVLALAGKTLSIGDHRVVVGVPASRALVPSASLYSRLVVIKGFMEPEPFLDAVKRKLVEMKVNAAPSLVSTAGAVEVNADRSGGTRSPWIRRTLRIHDKEIVGFAVRIEQLTAEESVLVQERGIGGRRRFGCGLFIPERER